MKVIAERLLDRAITMAGYNRDFAYAPANQIFERVFDKRPAVDFQKAFWEISSDVPDAPCSASGKNYSVHIPIPFCSRQDNCLSSPMRRDRWITPPETRLSGVSIEECGVPDLEFRRGRLLSPVTPQQG